MWIATPSKLFALLLVAATLPCTTHCRDPCGPVKQQGPDIPKNTCNRTIDRVTRPSVYGASLLNDGTGLEITWYNCIPVVYDVCAAFNASDVPLGVWNWTDAGSRCVMGFWIPPYPGTAPKPSYEACMDNIYTPMFNIGMDYGGTAYNQVTVNIVTMPDDYQTGSQVDAGYPSYTITYLPLQRGSAFPRSGLLRKMNRRRLLGF